MVRYFLRGLTMPLEFDLHSGLNTIGRNPTNDFRISDVSVSSFHCELTVTDQGILVRDLQSTNGTFINDEPVVEGYLSVNQVLQLGTVTVRLETQEIEIRVPTPVVPVVAPDEVPIKVLPEGVLACSREPSNPATHTCSKCRLPFHVSALRGVRLSGGNNALKFCPECDGPCEIIPGIDESQAKKSLFGKLTSTIALGWRRK